MPALQVYGADKVWKQISREGVKRSKAVRTTVSEAKVPRQLTE